jgi:hypothetical protein
MQVKFQIFGFKVIPYKNKKGGDDKMIVYQALMEADGDRPAGICELMLPKEHPECIPGYYFGELTPVIGFADKRGGGAYTKMTPRPAPAAVPPPAAK